MRPSRRANAGNTIARRWRPWLWDDRSQLLRGDAPPDEQMTGLSDTPFPEQSDSPPISSQARDSVNGAPDIRNA